jgi:Tfp pilus assembly protein PilO
MKRPKILFLLILAAVILSGIIFFFYAKSAFSSIKNLRASIAEFQKKSQEELNKNTGVIQNPEELFPEKGNISEFIENAYRTSKQRGVRNLSFEQKTTEFIDLSSGKVLKSIPVSEKKPRVIYVYPVKFSFDSGFRNMAEFIREIQNQKRLVTIQSLTVKRDIDHLSTDMVIAVYSMEER